MPPMDNDNNQNYGSKGLLTDKQAQEEAIKKRAARAYWDEPVAEASQENAAAMQKGATSRGTSFAEGWKNVKSGLGLNK